MRSHHLRAAAGGGRYTVGEFYPMFGVKLDDGYDHGDISSQPANSTKVEQPMQRALSFDTANTTELDGTETFSAIKTILDTSLYTCNPDFGASGNYISAIKLEHYNTSGTLLNYGEFAFDGTTFNIYDHACNALPNRHTGNAGGGSGLFSHPTALGSITSASLDGNSLNIGSYDYRNHILVNSTSRGSGNANTTYSSWSLDYGDYCFLGITDKSHTNEASDLLDTQFATTKGLAFGISDSDGVASVDPLGVNHIQVPPRTINLGINRRGTGYRSLCTNWQQRDNTGHGGHTTSGYFLVYGKYKS
tara:strand:- start:439 stop:1350 length:912 start_codon:yes stop_codon:yes gene_type:complete